MCVGTASNCSPSTLSQVPTTAKGSGLEGVGDGGSGLKVELAVGDGGSGLEAVGDDLEAGEDSGVELTGGNTENSSPTKSLPDT